jgi:hypothetical protein
VSVFLRWGIFGILGFAALMYAYNASKRMAEKHSMREPPAVVANVPDAGVVSTPAPVPDHPPAAVPSTPPHCEAELVVAQRALEARRQNEPVDRLLRIQEIAFQEPRRRERLEKVATRWYQWEGEDPIPEALRIAVITDCVRFSPAP